jgi:NTE family protein
MPPLGPANPSHTVIAMETRALVLGGGGVTGIAWELGLLHGLAEGGVDLSAAEVVIGTSAGSVVGAQVAAGTTLAELYAAQLEPADAEIGAKFGTGTLVRMALPAIIPGSPYTKRRRIGRAALRAHPESADARLAVIRSRIGVTDWPERDLRITAVDATTGRLRVFTRDTGVDLVHAVAASCAVPIVWPPVRIDGVPYVDGGMRSATNADLATGAQRVVVVAPLVQSFSRHMSIGNQLSRLRASGTTASAVISPDEASLAAIGRNVLDPAKRADAARAGLCQAATALDRVRDAWS